MVDCCVVVVLVVHPALGVVANGIDWGIVKEDCISFIVPLHFFDIPWRQEGGCGWLGLGQAAAANGVMRVPWGLRMIIDGDDISKKEAS